MIEDLHWVDASTEEHLNALMGSVAGAPIMVLMTYRVGYNSPFGSRSFFATLTLWTRPRARRSSSKRWRRRSSTREEGANVYCAVRPWGGRCLSMAP